MSAAHALLSLDEPRAVDALVAHLQRVYAEAAATGILLGLSGGVDSAVFAALAARACGSDAVHAAYLYDRDSAEILGLRARQVAEWLGIDFVAISIDAAMSDAGVYASPGHRITSCLPAITRALHMLYRLAFGETAFMSSLREGNALASKQDVGSLGTRSMIQYVEEGVNARHIYRRRLLEKMAETNNWLLIGAANRSEWLIGWFVKGGVDDLPIQPLKGLYKTQVRQLAAYLGIPDEIIRQAPSPDMVRGITDEFSLGMRYERIDLCLDCLAGGLSEAQMAEVGISAKETCMVEEMNRLSGWKRSAGDPPPVDGGPLGGFRA